MLAELNCCLFCPVNIKLFLFHVSSYICDVRDLRPLGLGPPGLWALTRLFSLGDLVKIVAWYMGICACRRHRPRLGSQTKDGLAEQYWCPLGTVPPSRSSSNLLKLPALAAHCLSNCPI